MSNLSSQDKEYTVVLRGPSAAIFPKDKDLNFTDYPLPKNKRGNIIFKTRWITTPDGVELPGHILVVVKGYSDEALIATCESFATTAILLLHAVSFCANAAVGQVELEVGYESTPDLESRDFFQNYLPDEDYHVHNWRIIDRDPTSAFLLEKHLHDESERLSRAVYQYHIALNHWKMNHDHMCLAHLWMAIEALTKVKIRQELQVRGFDNEKDLADDLGIDIRQLDGQVRKQMLLKGDAECYKKGKKASDGFEHGYLGIKNVQKIAEDTREKLAGYVREAILDLVGLEDKYKKRLTSDVFSFPIGYWPYAQYLKGKLINAKDHIAKEGNEFPYVDWDCRVKDFKIDEQDSKVKFQLENKFTEQISKGAKFESLKYELHRQI